MSQERNRYHATGTGRSGEPLKPGPVLRGLTAEDLKASLDELAADGRIVIVMDEYGVNRYVPRKLAKTILAGGAN